MLQAIGKRILLRVVDVKSNSPILQIEERKQWQIGRVTFVGDEVEGVEEDQFVWFRAHAGLILQYDSIEYLSLDVGEILGVSEDLL